MKKIHLNYGIWTEEEEEREKTNNNNNKKELRQNSYEYDQFRSFILGLFHHAHTVDEKNMRHLKMRRKKNVHKNLQKAEAAARTTS